MKKNIVDIVSLALVCIAVGGVALANAVQPDRPTVSEVENRTLAEMPDFSAEALFDGSYFRGSSAFFSDTFLERDRLVSLSKKMDTLKGVDYRPDGEDAFILLSTSGGEAETSDDEMQAMLDAAFKELYGETDAPETGIPETEVPETAAAETDLPETSSPETAPAETDAPETEPAETEAPARLTLTKSQVKLTVGSGAVVYAVPEPADEAFSADRVTWRLSDEGIASVSLNANGGFDIKGLAAGTSTLTVCYEDCQAECEITVTEITGVTQTGQAADFVTSDMFIYGDAVYTIAYYSEECSSNYARTAAYYKSLFGENVRVSIATAPISSAMVDTEAVKAVIPDQGEMLLKLGGLVDPSVNFADTYTPMRLHRDEYLFFKSDHHWTQRGAYYAYTAFAESIGLTPTPLEEFDYSVINEAYSGSMYSFTKDERVRQFKDKIEVFLSKKPHTMTVTTSSGSVYTYDSAVAPYSTTYSAFIAGDNPYTVINVPENPQDFNILVLKDSFGNALVPFLCEHFGNIIVVDVRHASFNIYEQLKDYGLTDILFVNNIQAVNSYAWSKMYLEAAGGAG